MAGKKVEPEKTTATTPDAKASTLPKTPQTDTKAAAETVKEKSTSPPAETKEEKSNHPIKVIGPIPTTERAMLKVSIFTNERELEGEKVTLYSAVLQKSYRTTEGGWATTQSLNRGELKLAALLLENAHATISELAGNGH